MLPGIVVRELKKLLDERGMFCELMRKDWRDLLVEDEVVQANLSLTYPGIIRAWHRHTRGQVDYFVVLRGALRICAYDDEAESETYGQLTEIVSSSEKLQVVRIPGHYWHGFKVIGSEPAVLLYFVSRLFDYQHPDEQRRPWNDHKIIDPATGEPFDWNRLPHK